MICQNKTKHISLILKPLSRLLASFPMSPIYNLADFNMNVYYNVISLSCGRVTIGDNALSPTESCISSTDELHCEHILDLTHEKSDELPMHPDKVSDVHPRRNRICVSANIYCTLSYVSSRSGDSLYMGSSVISAAQASSVSLHSPFISPPPLPSAVLDWTRVTRSLSSTASTLSTTSTTLSSTPYPPNSTPSILIPLRISLAAIAVSSHQLKTCLGVIPHLLLRCHLIFPTCIAAIPSILYPLRCPLL